MHTSTLDLENPRAPKPPLKSAGNSGFVQGLSAAAREKELQRVEGMKIAQSAVQGIGMSTKEIRGSWMSTPDYALAVSLLFTRATSQRIMLGTEPNHVLSTSLLCNSLLHDSRFMQVRKGLLSLRQKQSRRERKLKVKKLLSNCLVETELALTL